jgi:hypothetical protein
MITDDALRAGLSEELDKRGTPNRVLAVPPQYQEARRVR